MPKFFVENNHIQDNTITITGNDVNHIKNVLRKKEKETITVCNKDNKKDYLCEISKLEESIITCKILEELEESAEADILVSIFQGLPKADKMELIIQKAVELGVHDITPVEMKRCVVKLQEKDKTKKVLRWQKIAEVAAKQSGRNCIPEIKDVISLKKVYQLLEKYDIVIVAYENEKENKLKYEIEKLKKEQRENLKIAILIGPEGGIDKEEVSELRENGSKIVTLGNRILRTETVALNVLSIIMYEFD